MRKISRAEEQHDSLNFRTADAESWGQKEHFRVVDDATPITPHNPKGRDQCGLCSGSGLTEDEEKRSLACPHCSGRGVI